MPFFFFLQWALIDLSQPKTEWNFPTEDRERSKTHFLWVNLMKSMTQNGIGEDYFSWSTLKKHPLIYICVRCRGRNSEMWLVGCLRNSLLSWTTLWKNSYLEWLDDNLFSQFYFDVAVIWEVCPSKVSEFQAFKILKIQDFQASRFFQALNQNSMWVRVGILLDWEGQLENNTRDFSVKRLRFFQWLFPRVRQSLSGNPVLSADIVICYELWCFHGFVLITPGI